MCRRHAARSGTDSSAFMRELAWEGPGGAAREGDVDLSSSVLLVDNDGGARRKMRGWFEEAGFQVFEYESGAAVLAEGTPRAGLACLGLELTDRLSEDVLHGLLVDHGV